MGDLNLEAERKRGLRFMFLFVFLDLCCAGIFVPLLPFYAATFGATTSQTGFLLGTYSFAQLIASPFMGTLSDRWGRKTVLLVCFFGMGLGYLSLAASSSLAMLFFSRALAGILGANNVVAQAYIADITDESSRTKGLGLFGAAFGLGFTIGPAVGGALSVWGYRLPALVASVITFVNCVLTWVLLRDSRLIAVAGPVPPSSSDGKETGASAAGGLAAIVRMGRRKDASDRAALALLLMRALYGVAFYLFRNAFPIFSRDQLGLNARSTGMLLSYLGLLAGGTQGRAVGKLSAKYGDGALMVGGAALMGVSLWGWAVSSTVWADMLTLIPLALGNGIVMTCTTSALTQVVSKGETGTVLGVSASVDSINKVLMPPLAGYAIQHHGTSAPGIVGALVMAVATLYARTLVLPSPAARDVKLR